MAACNLHAKAGRATIWIVRSALLSLGFLFRAQAELDFFRPRRPAHLHPGGGSVGAIQSYQQGCLLADGFGRRNVKDILLLPSAQIGCDARETSCLHGLLALAKHTFPKVRVSSAREIPALALIP